jgi:hypothetical protein
MSDEFVHLENTEQPKSDKVDQTASDKVDQTESNKEQTEELSKFFTSILSQDGEIKENNNIISNLLGGILRNLIKNNLDEKEQSGSENESDNESENDSENDDNESENDDNESENDDSENDENGNDKDKQSEAESDDSDNYTEMFIILENKKSYNYATSYPRARRTLLARFHRFLENNSSTYMRIEKESERIVVYERQPNTLSPYDEQLLYQIEFFSVEKYVDC